MAFAWLFEGNFESGDNSEWDSEADTGSLLDFPHYTTLAAIPGMEVPWRGAYCARIVLGDTNDHTLTAGAVNISADGTFGVRFMLYLHSDVTATADDTFPLLELQASSTVEIAVGLKITASSGAIELGVGETAPSSFAANPLQTGRWYQVEVHGNIDSGGGSDDGDATLRLDGASVATLSGLTQNAITDAVFGSQDTESTTTGTILLDEFVADDARVGIMEDRWPEEVYLTKSSHVFVGPGQVDNTTLRSGAGTDCVLEVYDTDTADTTSIYNQRAALANTANNEIVDPAGMPVLDIRRGCYVALSGTNPRAIVKVRRAVAWGSTGAVRQYGIRRTA